jgi:hypothetical protein
MFGNHDENRCVGYETISTTEILRLRVLERIIHRHLGRYKSRSHRIAIPGMVLLGRRQDFVQDSGQITWNRQRTAHRPFSPMVYVDLGLTDVHMGDISGFVIGFRGVEATHQPMIAKDSRLCGAMLQRRTI